MARNALKYLLEKHNLNVGSLRANMPLNNDLLAVSAHVIKELIKEKRTKSPRVYMSVIASLNHCISTQVTPQNQTIAYEWEEVFLVKHQRFIGSSKMLLSTGSGGTHLPEVNSKKGTGGTV